MRFAFDTLDYLKENDRTWNGFIEALRIIKDTNIFAQNQGNGTVKEDWTKHRTQCTACMGALLAWFWHKNPDEQHSRSCSVGHDNEYHYNDGVKKAAEYSRMSEPQFTSRIKAAIRKVLQKKGVEYEGNQGYESPWGSGSWGEADFVEVFEEFKTSESLV